MILLFLSVYFVLTVLVYVIYKIIKFSLDNKNNRAVDNSYHDFEDLIKSANNKEISNFGNKKVEVKSIKEDILNNCILNNVSVFEYLNNPKYKKYLYEIDRIIDKEFDFNSEKIIKEFINKTDEGKSYDFCKKLESKFNLNKLYELKTSTDDEVLEKIKKMLNEEEYKILELYLDTHFEFILDDFISYLSELVRLNDPTITVYVGNRDDNFDYLNKFVKTKVDDSIYRGIKIGYRGHIYDFSLSGRNI